MTTIMPQLRSRSKKKTWSVNEYVHSSLLMFLRRLYLSYTVILACLLIIIEGFSFGIQLYFSLRNLELHPNKYSWYRRFGIEVCIASAILLGVMVCAKILSKGVMFMRMIWRREQYLLMYRKLRRFFSGTPINTKERFLPLLFQGFMIFLVEILPLVISLIIFAIYVQSDYLLGVKCFLSFGSLMTLCVIIFWWLCSTLADSRRMVLMMCCSKHHIFQVKLQNLEDELHVERIPNPEDVLINSEHDDIIEFTPEELFTIAGAIYQDQYHLNKLESFRQFKKENPSVNFEEFVTQEEKQEEDNEKTLLEATTPETPAVSRSRSDSVAQMFASNYRPESKKEKLDTLDVKTRRIRHLRSLSTHVQDMDEEQRTSTIIEQNMENFSKTQPHHSEPHHSLTVKRQTNIWVMTYLFCCWLPLIKIPTPCFKSSKYVRLKLQHVWLVLLFILASIIVIISGVFNLIPLFVVLLVLLCIWILNFLLEQSIYIPPHTPSAKRVRANFSRPSRLWFIHRWISISEDVFFHSPFVVFGICRLATYTHIMFVTVCMIFKFYSTIVLFVPTFCMCLILMLLYILRFNLFRPNSFISSSKKKEDEQLLSSKQPSYHTTDAVVNQVDEEAEEAPFSSDTDYLHVPWESNVFRILTHMSLWLFLFGGQLIVLLIMFISSGWLAGLLFLVLILSYNFILFKRYDALNAPAWNAFFYLFVVVISVIFLLGSVNSVTKNASPHAKTGVFYEPSPIPYAICEKTWYGFNIKDYALFSYLSYQTVDYIEHDFQTWFPNCTDCTATRYENEIVFYDFYIPSRNLSVIAVRGTDNFIDLIQDFALWKEIVLFQWMSYIGPFVNFWPTTLTIDIVYWISRIESTVMNPFIYSEQFYYDILEKKLKELVKTRRVVLTGHSLGGGLVKIKHATDEQLRAITFSAPGIVYSSRKFGTSWDSINEHVVNIVPQNDLVPQVDQNGGLIQHIHCPGTPISCHKIGTTSRELLKSCGDFPLGRWVDD
mmetsp:Transcript_2940/g.4284  ORF Transcript_2940/g.4284 Transcript_2940/m.4284 type:complete len:997 (+) Transcript_2940:1325-4315(+)